MRSTAINKLLLLLPASVGSLQSHLQFLSFAAMTGSRRRHAAVVDNNNVDSVFVLRAHDTLQMLHVKSNTVKRHKFKVSLRVRLSK